MRKYSLFLGAAILFSGFSTPAAPLSPLAFWEKMAGDDYDERLALVGSCAASGELAKARELALRIQGKDVRGAAVRFLMRHAQTPEQTRALLPEAKRLFGKEYSRSYLASMMAKAGDMPGALKMNTRAQGDGPFSVDLAGVCAEAVTLKDLELAVNAIPKIMPEALKHLNRDALDEDDMMRLQARESESYQAAANRAAELGHIQRAKALMEKAIALASAADWVMPERISPGFAKHRELEPLAKQMMIQVGKTKFPWAFCGHATHEEIDRSRGPIRDNMIALTEAGKPKLARESLALTKDPKMRKFTQAEFARYHIRKKRLPEALATARRLKDLELIYECQRAMAEQQLAQGKKALARESLRQAVQAIRQHKPKFRAERKVTNLAELARLTARAGDAEGAKNIFLEANLAANQIDHREDRLGFHGRIAFEQARAGLGPAAEAQFQPVLDELRKHHERYKNAPPPRNENEKQMRVIKFIPRHAVILGTLLDAAQFLKGDESAAPLVRALIEQEIKFLNDGGKPFYLAIIAEWLGGQGRLEQALDVAEKIKSPTLRHHLLRRLAQYLATTQSPAQWQNRYLLGWAYAEDAVQIFWRPPSHYYHECLDQATPLKPAFTPAEQKLAQRILRLTKRN